MQNKDCKLKAGKDDNCAHEVSKYLGLRYP
jgi:hypothetical protein